MAPFKGKVEIIIYAYPPDDRRRDIDNVLKALLDALEKGGLYENDNQIRKLTIEDSGQKGGFVEVYVNELKLQA